MAEKLITKGKLDQLMRTKGKHSDGGGLILQVTSPGSASWVFRYKDRQTHKERWPCIGPAKTYTLDEARDKARLCRVELHEGRDPAAFLAANRRAAPAGKLFSTAMAEYLKIKAPTWAASNRDRELRRYAFLFGQVPEFTALPLRTIDQDAKNKALSNWPVGSKQRRDIGFYIEAIIRYVETGKLRLKKKRVVAHHEAMPWADVPAFFARLSETDTIGARALAFTILTGSRTDEVIGTKRKGKWTKLPATWGEITEEDGKPVWAIPDDRMKAGLQHSVPLTPQMLALLGDRRADNIPLFKVGNQNAMLNTLKSLDSNDYTVHGFRSSFEDWGAEATIFPRDLVKLCTAHDTRTETDRAYQRSALLAKRREILESWSNFVSP
ncbi:tyrosine-type recombinase/integrase [Bradyrhizobium canariense]|uniref:Integrase DNA-binding domain-containing protein n=1 Tax=Bradyrhizobium canariense TaxID=255045 RepID=A0A1X3GV94_9BRAD|nr:integrase family protein [Bradyrhizobium canariense]OSI70875.1 hypothetical protein BSZ22_13230 [Bradyrhizobium canariense]OSI79716.1 hypothetical protein BSZ23_13750 [Bradyrhizobium canariense]OSI92333.1 hypothetical protein BSZ25_12735 [Bradyrhizobium canariense]OSI94055.1 hypothetical protein BSZ24_11490 [Bradyrhizobium canariense]OSJ01772.1 hypothetical protein BSZ18_38895 [Bradyrhizobium canariense]